MQTLIGPEQDFALWAVLFGLAAFGFWVERYPWGRKYSGVMIMMTAAAVLHDNPQVSEPKSAADVARQLEQGVVVTVLPDNGLKYLSERFWSE